jgi:formylglycine-generating enzyme required for sulfatase activity
MRSLRGFFGTSIYNGIDRNPSQLLLMAQFSIAKHPQKIHYFEEPFHPNPQHVVKPMRMVLILGGTFQMGSPETELDRFENESPQHEVTVPSFFMSEFLIP